MAFKHILVPYDKSESAGRALGQAVEMAKEDTDVRIDLLSVLEMPPLDLPISSYSEELMESKPVPLDAEEIARARGAALESERNRVLGSAHDFYRGIESQVSVTVIPGISPIREIVDYASEKGCDLIVMGNRGLGAIRGMLGSVSYGVLRSADVPVMVVK